MSIPNGIGWTCLEVACLPLGLPQLRRGRAQNNGRRRINAPGRRTPSALPNTPVAVERAVLLDAGALQSCPWASSYVCSECRQIYASGPVPLRLCLSGSAVTQSRYAACQYEMVHSRACL